MKVLVEIELPQETMRRLEILAKEAGVTVSELVSKWIVGVDARFREFVQIWLSEQRKG